MLHFFLLQFMLGCEQINSTSSEPLVSAEDRALLEKLKREEQARQEKLARYNDLMTNPDKFIKSGAGSVDVYDKGIFNSYTEIKKYPVKNTSEFEVSSISAQIEVKDSSYKLIGIVPAEFQGKLRPGEDSLLSIRTTTTLQGKGQHFTLSVKSVSAQRPD